MMRNSLGAARGLTPATRAGSTAKSNLLLARPLPWQETGWPVVDPATAIRNGLDFETIGVQAPVLYSLQELKEVPCLFHSVVWISATHFKRGLAGAMTVPGVVIDNFIEVGAEREHRDKLRKKRYYHHFTNGQSLGASQH